ncbi:MAG: hypothetical protein OEY93_05335, partial [Anaerolineae bacterium]|nr:hypothetical protein [Anaerolineae bacterium]
LPIDPPITKESDAKGVYNVFWPGVYPKGIHISWGGGRQKFKSGLYCLGADFKVTNGQVTNYTATEGATFYLYNGSVSLSSSNFINLHAPQHGEVVDPSGNNWDGMLFYIDEDNNGVFDVTGNADTTLEGTVYAPGLPPGNTAKCKITGSGSLKNPDDTTSGNYDLQLLCYTIEITGSADVTITYDGDKAYKPPTTLDLYK